MKAPKERAVLGVLGLRAGVMVGSSELIEVLWGEAPPVSAGKAAQAYVSALRPRLPAGAIDTVGGGYRLNIDRDRVDVVVFEQQLRGGQQVLEAGDPQGAAGLLRRALGLWRGAPLVELADQPWGTAQAAGLAEERRNGEELPAEARLAIGEASSLIGELELAVTAEALRERRWGQLMSTLYRAGRQAEALRAFGGCRTSWLTSWVSNRAPSCGTWRKPFSCRNRNWSAGRWLCHPATQRSPRFSPPRRWPLVRWSL
jgi:DNA-binding SARP family transcriptional activator